MLPSDENPNARAEASLSTVTDDEFFAAVDEPDLTDDQGDAVDHTEGVVDDR